MNTANETTHFYQQSLPLGLWRCKYDRDLARHTAFARRQRSAESGEQRVSRSPNDGNSARNTAETTCRNNRAGVAAVRRHGALRQALSEL